MTATESPILTAEQGAELVRLARELVEARVREGRPLPAKDPPDAWWQDHVGVFVTLTEVDDRGQEELRGCIGTAEPRYPLIQALAYAAGGVCTGDPRFPAVTAEELGRLRVEVSVPFGLRELQVRSPLELPSLVHVGRHGLVVRVGSAQGVLLPQAAFEHEWDAQEFLSQACMKAGALPDAWLLPGTHVMVFEALVFAEEAPRGEVTQRSLR